MVAWVAMRDVGFTPDAAARPLAAVRAVLVGSDDGGLRNPPVRWLMLAAVFTSGTGLYVFYALQPFLLELAGDPGAYSIAGLAAADGALMIDLSLMRGVFVSLALIFIKW